MNGGFEDFVGIISSLNKEIQRIKAERMRALGLRGTDTMVLYYLSQHPEGMAEVDLTRAIGVDRAAVSRTVSKLQKDGYVERVTWEDSARYRVPVRLTQVGRQVADEVNQAIEAIVEDVGGEVEREDLDRTYESLSAILRRLEKIS